jgi:hypothetical protein
VPRTRNASELQAPALRNDRFVLKEKDGILSFAGQMTGPTIQERELKLARPIIRGKPGERPKPHTAPEK